MYFSKREKKIIEILLDQKSGIALEYLSDELNVSKRTIYREMSSLESTLAHHQIKLVRDPEGYRITGSDVLINELRDTVQETKEDLTAQQRQSALIIQLLLDEEEVKMEALAAGLNVSIGTIHSDLQSIEKIFEDYNVRIQRKKAKGIRAVAEEKSFRLILSGLINNEVNEYDFFQLMGNLATKNEDAAWDQIQNPFLRVLNPIDLGIAYTVVNQFGDAFFEEVTDTQFQRLVILLSLSIIRLRQKKLITGMDKETENLKNTNSFEIAQRIYQHIQKKVDLEIPDDEMTFLAMQIQGLSVPIRKEIFFDDYASNLGYKTRELIRVVSNRMGWNFNQDETLFIDLLAHVSAAIKRTIAPIPEGTNPLLEKIQIQYPELSEAVEKSLEEVFPEVAFLSNETLYIVIHFASAYERVPKVQKLSVLVICSSGVGTAKILESRLRKNIAEISHIKISRISKLNQLNVKDYDLILSTLFLPGFESEYKVVTPLLMDDEIRSIQLYIRHILNEKGKQQIAKNHHKTVNTDDELNFKEFYQQLTTINQLLDCFNIVPISDYSTIDDLILTICKRLEGTVLSNSDKIKNKLFDRMEAAPIGLPGTSMGFFHTIDEDIHQLFFSIYEIPKPLTIKSIDKKEIQMRRVILMLGPDPISEGDQEILGSISAAMVESDLNMEIFNSGSKKLINDCLSNLFLDKLKR